MRSTTAIALKNNLAAELDRVQADGEPLVIVGSSGQPTAVLISLADFGSDEETRRLLASPENARRLREAIAEYHAGKGVERKLVE